jgi:hypothetical protein
MAENWPLFECSPLAGGKTSTLKVREARDGLERLPKMDGFCRNEIKSVPQGPKEFV